MVAKFRAGQKTQVTSFDSTFPESRGTISVFLIVNPTAMQINIVSIGVSVAKNASNIMYSPKALISFLNSDIHFSTLNMMCQVNYIFDISF